MLVQVSDGGVTGWGEALPLPGWPGTDLSATRRALEQWAGDPDPDDLPNERFAHGAVELALLDLEARRTGQTQAAVLAAGGAVADSIEVNALVSDAHTAAAAVAAGFRTVKLKVGASDLDEDVASVAAVRNAVGADTRLRLDANGAWTVGEAAKALARLEQYEIEYVEEPVAGIESLAQVVSQSPIPVAVDDSLGSVDAQVPESISVIVVKPMALGGPRTAIAAARRWADQGRKVAVTNYMDSAIGQHAALSVAAALPGPPQVHGAITPLLFMQDIAELPLVTHGQCPLPSHSPVPVGINLDD
ncbi:MAG: o-succinylbenzoate synthase [bacterium]|nr:o-succinylbenzoate synthase [bacterium]